MHKFLIVLLIALLPYIVVSEVQGPYPQSQKNINCAFNPFSVKDHFFLISTPGEFERYALEYIEKSRMGDPEALFVMSLVASGNVHSLETYLEYRQVIENLLTDVNNQLNSDDTEYEKARIIYNLFHTKILKAEVDYPGLSHYAPEQSQMSKIFETGEYNCISASLLAMSIFALAGYEVEGVLVPYHSYIVIDHQNMTAVEIETTDINGFDIQYSKEKFRQISRQLYAEYNIITDPDDFAKREMVKPYKLITANMSSQHLAQNILDQNQVNTVFQFRAFLDPENLSAQRDVMTIYHNWYVDMIEWECNEALMQMNSLIIPYLELVQKGNLVNELAPDIAGLYTDVAIGEYLNLADLQLNEITMDRFHKAMGFLSKSLQFIEQYPIDNKEITGNNVSLIVNITSLMQDNYLYEEAYDYLSSVSEICNEYEDFRKSFCYLLGNWGVYLSENGNIGEGIEKYKHAIACIDANGFSTDEKEYSYLLKSNIFSGHNQMGLSYLENSEYEQAIASFKACDECCNIPERSTLIVGNILMTYIEWASDLYDHERYREAESVCNEALQEYGDMLEYLEEIEYLKEVKKFSRQNRK